MQLSDKFTFGKYKGKTLQEVINDYPTYVLWCQHNVKGFDIDNGIDIWKYIDNKYGSIYEEDEY